MKRKTFGFLALVGITAIAGTIAVTSMNENGLYALPALKKADYSVRIGLLTSKIENNKLVFKTDSGHEIKYEYTGHIEQYRLDDYFFAFGGKENICLTPIKGESRIRNINRVVITGQKLNSIGVNKVYFEGDTMREDSDYSSQGGSDESLTYDLRGDNCSYIIIKKDIRYENYEEYAYIKSITITYSCKPGSENA